MTTSEQKLISKIENLNTDSLKDMAIELFLDKREGTDLVFSTILFVLESRISEDEFVSFCDELEAA